MNAIKIQIKFAKSLKVISKIPYLKYFDRLKVEMNRTKEPSHTTSLTFHGEHSLETLFLHQLNLEKSAIDSLNFTTETFVISGLCVSLFVGSYFKSALYSYFCKNYKDLVEKPINLLLLIQAVIQHLICLLMVVYYTTGLFFNIRLADHIGGFWCNVSWYLQVYGVAYRNVGSLGIAIFRLLYLRCNDWIKERVGRLEAFCVVLFLSLAFSAMLTAGFAMGNGPISRKQVTWNFCLGQSETLREILDGYSLATGQAYSSSELGPQLALFLALACVIAELVCYILFFNHVYYHDKGLLSRKILSDGEFKRRRRVNAITFLGQFYGFFAECILYFGTIFTLHESSDIVNRVSIVLCIWFEFGVVSIVEVITSKDLRKFLPHNLCFN